MTPTDEEVHVKALEQPPNGSCGEIVVSALRGSFVLHYCPFSKRLMDKDDPIFLSYDEIKEPQWSHSAPWDRTVSCNNQLHSEGLNRHQTRESAQILDRGISYDTKVEIGHVHYADDMMIYTQSMKELPLKKVGWSSNVKRKSLTFWGKTLIPFLAGS